MLKIKKTAHISLSRLCVPVILLVFFLPVISACPRDDFESQRLLMVRDQIVSRGIRDPRVVKAMRQVERHLFVPAQIAHMAYDDRPLPIGYNQTISQPYIVAYMTEILDLKPEDKVLEIGTGSGYQAAVLGEISSSVYTIEVIPQLGERSTALLKDLGYDNITVKIGDGYKGWKEHAPFDAIIVTCSPTHIPEPLIEHLAEGGRMIIPVGDKHVQELVFLIKKDGEMLQKAVLPVRFVPMIDEKGEEY